jgi:hypothetical protein
VNLEYLMLLDRLVAEQGSTGLRWFMETERLASVAGDVACGEADAVARYLYAAGCTLFTHFSASVRWICPMHYWIYSSSLSRAPPSVSLLAMSFFPGPLGSSCISLALAFQDSIKRTLVDNRHPYHPTDDLP